LGPRRPRADLGSFRARPGDTQDGTFPGRPNGITSSTSGPVNVDTKKKKKKNKKKKKTKKKKKKTTMAIIMTMPITSSIVMIKGTTMTTLTIAMIKAMTMTMVTETITQTMTTIRMSHDDDPQIYESLTAPQPQPQ